MRILQICRPDKRSSRAHTRACTQQKFHSSAAARDEHLTPIGSMKGGGAGDPGSSEGQGRKYTPVMWRLAWMWPAFKAAQGNRSENTQATPLHVHARTHARGDPFHVFKRRTAKPSNQVVKHLLMWPFLEKLNNGRSH